MNDFTLFIDDFDNYANRLNIPTFAQFAFLGVTKVYVEKLAFLADIADSEVWTCGERKYDILASYLSITFQRCYLEDKIVYSKDGDYCGWNTGLVTHSQEDIICLLNINRQVGAQKWFLNAFLKKSDRDIMQHFGCCPPLAAYTKDFKEYNFNGFINIQCDVEHILEDNWSRIEDEVGEINKDLGRVIFDGAMKSLETRVLRNVRLAIPQYYRGKIMFLLPIEFPLYSGKITMPLALQYVKGQYRANTILTIEMAYVRARVLMRLKGTWLEEELLAKHQRITKGNNKENDE